jgi:hypothetical protein
MSILKTFYILFESDTSKLKTGLDESNKGAKGLTENLAAADKEGLKLGNGLAEVIGKTAGLFGLGLSVKALADGIKETAKSYDELDKLATRLRATTDDLDGFLDATELLGFSGDVAEESLISLDKAIADMSFDMGRAKKVFEELGLSATDSNGKMKPTLQIVGELSEKFKTMERGQQLRVMERLGLNPALLKLFNADMADLNKRMTAIDSAARFSLDEALKRSKDYTKANKEMNLELATLTMFFDKLGEKLKLEAMTWFTAAIKKGTEYLRIFVDFALKHGPLFEGAMIAIAAAISTILVPAAARGALAVWAMVAPFALTALAVAAAVAVFALAYDDIVTFMDGGDSALGRLLKKFPWLSDVAKGIGAVLLFVAQSLNTLLIGLLKMLTDPEAAFKGMMQGWSDAVYQFIELFPGLKDALESVGIIVGEVKDFVLKKWDDMINFLGEAMFNGVEKIKEAWDYISEKIGAAIDYVMGKLDAIGQAFGKVKDFFGFGGDVNLNVTRANTELGIASSNPLAAQTSMAISNNIRGPRSSSVSVGKIEITTGANAEDVNKAISGSLQNQMRSAVSGVDDGVLI